MYVFYRLLHRVLQEYPAHLMECSEAGISLEESMDQNNPKMEWD
jgi:hypothetical protein